MKILYFHQYFKTIDDAGSTRSYEMARRLVLMGHEVQMITSTSDRSKPRNTVIEGIDVHYLYVPYSNKLGFYRRVAAFAKYAICAALVGARANANLVFATSTPLTVILPAYVAAKANRCKLVFEVRDLWPEIPIAMGILKNAVLISIAKRLERFAYGFATHIVALSSGMRDGVVGSGISDSKITVIPNSADLDLFDPAKTDRGLFRKIHPEIPTGPIVLYPGTLGRVNGVDYLVNVAAHLLEKTEVSFVVIGDGSELEKTVLLSKANQTYQKNVFFLPSMPKREMAKAFRDADLVVSLIIDLPALEANSANKVFDALASGTALAVNHGGWQKDLIEHNKLGLALSRDSKISAQQICDFFSVLADVEHCGLRSRKVAKEQFSRDRLAHKLEAVLTAAL